MNRSFIICLVISSAGAFKISDFHKEPDQLIGGRPAGSGEVKYIVVIRDGSGLCGGGIIGEKLILTAAHCIDTTDHPRKLVNPIKVIAGTIHVSEYRDSDVIKRDVARAYLPGPLKKDGGLNDIAILELTKPLGLIKYRNRLQQLYLPEPITLNPVTYPTYENKHVKFAGYGDTNAILYDVHGKLEIDSFDSGRLNVADALINDAKICKRYMRPERFLDQMCLSIVEDKYNRRPQGTCSGDSGGPAVYDNNIVIGLVSRGVLCNTNVEPAIFTRVSYYIPFIKNVMKNITEDLLVYEARV